VTSGSGERTATYAVDRREGAIVVLVSDESGETVEVETRTLPRRCRAEGAVLRVRLDADGSPEWETALRDRVEERRRLDELAKRVERLRRTDPGGDVEL
jgi:hypothetical protein